MVNPRGFSGPTGFEGAGMESEEAHVGIEELIGRLPAGVGHEWTGLSYQQRMSESQAGLLYAAAQKSTLSEYLEDTALLRDDQDTSDDHQGVRLSTIHGAKGLEFNVVFICGLEEGLFPHENSLLEDKGQEEERRLMYVAVTRARQRLYLCHAQTRMLHGQTRYNLPSRFIDEIPAGLLKFLTARAGKSSYGAVSPGLTFDPTPRRRDGGGSGSGFRIGQTVMHAKFGLGVIVNAEGGGADARVQINFGNAGMKWLALSVAKLEPA